MEDDAVDISAEAGLFDAEEDTDVQNAAGVAAERTADDQVVTPLVAAVEEAVVTNPHAIDNAVWGMLKGNEISEAVNSAYLEVIRWRRNIFNLPTGKAGEEFIDELTKLYVHFNNGDAFESVALTMASIIFHLLLQKPAPLSKSAVKTRDHIRYLEKRLVQWRNGDLDSLLSEGRAIQSAFSRKKKNKPQKKINRFVMLMEQGKISAALRCIGSQETSLLTVTPEVVTELKTKHPNAQCAMPDSLLKGPLPKKLVEEVIFEAIDAQAISSAAKKVQGAAGPSGGDSDLWRRLLCSKQFKTKPANLCRALADLARKLNTTVVEPSHLKAFIAGRLVPLDKKPGVRPIAIGEMTRRIIGKATMHLIRPDLIEATSPLQTCAGIAGGIEASIHAMRKIFEDSETEAILLVDASNAFNALNRAAALHNVQYTCPSLWNFVNNLYSSQAQLFVANSEETILSKEGTTQGGPESMGFYAASTITLATPRVSDNSKQIFYADDGSAGGSLDSLHSWWSRLQQDGPPLGYFPNAGKTWLVVKPEHHAKAVELFPDVNITSEGHKYLGSYIGTQASTEMFVEEQIKEWSNDFDALANIANSEPQLVYSAYVYGTSKRWQFVCRTTPNIGRPLHKLELLIREKLIPAITGGRTVSEELRQVFALPARHGGLGLSNPVEECNFEYENSLLLTAQLVDSIFQQCGQLDLDEDELANAKREVASRKLARFQALQDQLRPNVSEDMWKVISLSAEKGSSTWLSSLPLKKFGFRLNKQQFEDALCMRYMLNLKDSPRRCACGGEYSINHCLTCKLGGYVNIRHNAVRDTFHQLAKETCKDVQLEPTLLPVTGENLPTGTNLADGARADISALSFWQPLCRAFFDVRVINPFAQSNWSKGIADMYAQHESLKKREYNQRILQVDKGSFSPLVFSCSGGTAPEAEKVLKHLAQKISLKRQESYSNVISFIRRRIRFDILRTCGFSFRGERSTMKPDVALADLEIGLCQMDICTE